MSKTFFADKILKFVMYNNKLKNKMTVFAIYDFFFQVSLIGDVIFAWMFVLREVKFENLVYTAVFSLLGGVFSTYFDLQKVRDGKLKLEEKKDTDLRDFIITIAVIAGYLGLLVAIFIITTK